MYSIKEAEVSLLSNCGIWCSAYPGKIIFGEIENDIFCSNKIFCLEKCYYTQFYFGLVKIVECIAESKTNVKEIILTKDLESLIYYFQINEISQIFALGIEKAFETQYKFVLNLELFNDFIFIIQKLILPSLCLSSEVQIVINAASSLPICDIENLSNRKNCSNFLLQNEVDPCKINIYLIYIEYYMEIIIMIHKLKTLYNPSIVQNVLSKFK